MAIIVQSTVYSLQTLYGVVPGNSVTNRRALSWEHGRKAGNAMHIKEMKDRLVEKAESLMKLADELTTRGGRKLTDRESRLLREVQAEVMIDSAKERITIWQNTGDEEHLTTIIDAFKYAINLEGHPK